MRPIRLFRAPFLALALSLGFVSGCVAPGGGPSVGAAAQAEADQSQRLLAELRRRDQLLEDRALNRYVSGVAARIEAQRPDGVPQMRTFIVANPEVNAFTSGAGYVFVNAGMLALLENEAQFAMVLAHEIAHVDRGHVARGMQTRQTVGLAGALAGVAGAMAGVPADLSRVAIGAGQQLTVARFSREQELEADVTGFRYAAAAGYNAAEGAKSFQVLRRLYGDRGAVAQFFASHPQSAERQALLQRMATSEAADRGRVARDPYLAATRGVRQQALQHYERAGRPAEARQARALLGR